MTFSFSELYLSDSNPSRGRQRSLSRNNSPVNANADDLMDDYAEIVDEDEDYSVPSSRFLKSLAQFCWKISID